MNPTFSRLAAAIGFHVMGVNQAALAFQPDQLALRMAADGGIACDAAPNLVTVSNAGIPAYLANYWDPKVIEVLTTPLEATNIVGSEVKKGDWTTKTAQFSVVELTGQTSAYGDYNENGVAGANANFPSRQSFHYQVMTQWGELELATMGLARIDYANQLNMASVLSLNTYQNYTYFYGVEGLENYGLLNDPGLYAPITPNINAAGTTSWTDATALEVLDDVSKLFAKLQSQSNGLINLKSVMTLAMSPTTEVALTKTTQFNVNVMDLLKKNYPNMTVKTAVQYGTDSGELLQLFVPNLMAQQTCETAFTEKLRAHPIVVGTSNFKQKKSQGTFGTVVYRPFLIAQMLGV